MKFGNFLKKSLDDDNNRASDDAIIHQSVPDEVLFPDGAPKELETLDWMDAEPVAKPVAKPEPKPAETAWASSRVKTRADVATTPDATQKVAAVTESSPNGEAADRPKKPVGWLVVVEGPGVGEWFVLEKGTSHIGSGEGQTVRLGFGDSAVATTRHAAVTYDDQKHTFELAGDITSNLRLNGQPVTSRVKLRDGDVFTVSQTSLRLVALCSANFHWE